MAGDEEEPAAAGAQAPRFNLNLKPPDPVRLAGKNAPEVWKLWKQIWENYCIVMRVRSQPEYYQRSLLISIMGTEALQIYNGSDPLDTDSAEDIIRKLDAHILGQTNETFQRFKFNIRAQKHDESYDTYLSSLKTLAKSCNFCDCLRDSLLRDRIVLGVVDDSLRKHLLQERELTLPKCSDICRSYENTSTQMQIISGNQDQIHGATAKKIQDKPVITCKFCGQQHIRKKESCFAWGKVCNKCKEKNHFARFCKTKSKKRIHGVQPSDSESDTEMLLSVTSNEINAVSTKKGPVYAEMEIARSGRIKFQIDCGATVNVIPWKYVQDHSLDESTASLHMYNMTTVKPVGKCRTILRNPETGKKYNVEFEVIKENFTPLLSRNAAEQMKLITINYDNFKLLNSVQEDDTENIIKKYSKVFNEKTVGCFPGEVHLAISSDAKAVQMPPRRIPIAVKPKLRKELDELVDQGVLKPVTEPTDWCSQISVQTKKDGKLRVCIDPKFLNEALVRERYPLPIIEDIFPEISKAKVFSKVDLKSGYWHCQLDEESSLLTTIITPFGRYRWCRLPFGTKVSSEIFQRKLHECIEGLEGVVSVADDILIFGENEEHHNKNLQSLLQRCSEMGIQLNKAKSTIKTDQLIFIGHIITNQGLKPDPSKIQTIMDMERPKDKEGVRRLQGMVTYLSKFLPKL